MEAETYIYFHDLKDKGMMGAHRVWIKTTDDEDYYLSRGGRTFGDQKIEIYKLIYSVTCVQINVEIPINHKALNKMYDYEKISQKIVSMALSDPKVTKSLIKNSYNNGFEEGKKEMKREFRRLIMY